MSTVLLAQGADKIQIFDVTLVGVSAVTGVKLLFTLGLALVVVALRGQALAVTRYLLGGEVADPRRFWACQSVQVVTTVVAIPVPSAPASPAREMYMSGVHS